MATEKPYTLANLICTLLALVIEGAVMVVGTTWIVVSHHGGMGTAYLFSALIAVLGVGLGVLQIHYYRKEKRILESEE